MNQTRRLRRSLASGAGVLLLLALSACTDDPDVTEPSFSPVPSEVTSADASPEPSPEPTPDASTAEALAPPELPAAATEETPEGAAAFAEWWFETLNYAFASGDTETLAAASQLSTCETCANFVESIDETYSTGGRYEGGQSQVSVEVAQQVDDRVATFPVRLMTEGGAVVAASGERQESPSENLVLVAAAVWNEGAWQMGDLRQ